MKRSILRGLLLIVIAIVLGVLGGVLESIDRTTVSWLLSRVGAFEGKLSN